MDLGVTVMAWRYTVVRLGRQDLIEFDLAILSSLVRVTGLKVTAAPSATVVIGHVGMHVNEVFLTNNRFNHKTQIFGHGIPKGFSDKLAGILNGKFYLQVFVPVRIYLKFSLPDPLCIVLNDAFYLKAMGNIEFLQSGPECE